MSPSHATPSGRAAAFTAVFLGWLVPGLGHFYLGKRGRAGLFFAGIGALFVLGVAMNARLTTFLGFEDVFESLRTIAQFFVGAGSFFARSLGFLEGDVKSVLYEYGNTFTEVAGLLNILAMLDAYDIATGRKS